MRRSEYAWVAVMVAAVMWAGAGVEGASVGGGKCGGFRWNSCGACTAVKGCGWCETPHDYGANATLRVVGCVEGGFAHGSGCGNAEYFAKQCSMANMYLILILVAVGLVLLCCCWACVWWKCRKRTKRKNAKLLDDYDSWVDSIRSDGATPKTSARRDEMRAKYGIGARDDSVPLR